MNAIDSLIQAGAPACVLADFIEETGLYEPFVCPDDDDEDRDTPVYWFFPQRSPTDPPRLFLPPTILRRLQSFTRGDAVHSAGYPTRRASLLALATALAYTT